jgi:hypothetical protein
MLADIQEKALDEALHELKGGRTGPKVRGRPHVGCEGVNRTWSRRANRRD